MDPKRKLEPNPHERPKSSRRKKKIRHIISKSPTSSACEFPILKTLESAPDHSLSLKSVIKQVTQSGKWFTNLTDDDLEARHPHSQRKIVETTLKFSRKNLALKGQLLPASPIPGIWKMTEQGLKRARDPGQTAGWMEKYSVRNAIILEDTEEGI
jgi:hypothetical protein